MDESNLASSLHTELSARFPEIAAEIEDDRELPYLQMHALVDWLARVSGNLRTTDAILRIRDFAAWCESQPRSDDAGSDVYTIFVVGFLEKIFCTEKSRAFLPHLLTKEQLITNADYLRRWVSEDDYNAALALYT
jgi:hypothetical protein